MSATDHAPFRADHVGSLLRPPALKEARERRARGAITAEALAEIEDRLIRDAVRMQEEVGLQSITDGDFRRQSWSSDFLVAIKGVTSAPIAVAPQTGTPVGGVVRDWQPPAPKITAKLEWPAGGIQHKSFAFLKSVTRRTPKVTMPSPSMLHFRGGRGAVDSAAYPEMERFFDDLAAVWHAEIMDLAAAGCRYVQLDDTNLAYLCDARLRQRVKGLGEDPDKLPALYARLINKAIAGRPADMKVAVHLCRGNSLSRGHAEGGYEPVAEAIFSEAKVDGFFLEYDDARSGDFAPLRFVPKGPLRIVLGLVTSKFGALELKDAIKRRIDEAMRYMPLDQMCLSPQCGFASHTGGNLLTEAEQRAKLRHVVELADEIWPTAR
ncbi:MAG TPA: 5-methyltetrahydropteroyltriglutamate--homocysteine S-methyltransferase [Stellaceae bacterium]|nr:5-methyltetrahydropteroyltriglutamate--homocysteine S-methyltransferase [Stellaceae bacterium]